MRDLEDGETFEEYVKAYLQELIRRDDPELAVVLGLWCPICGKDTVPTHEHDCNPSFQNLKGIVP